MRERKQRSVFTPGMQCPGGCGRVLNSREDLHHKYVACSPCGNKRYAELQAIGRAEAGQRCDKCNRPIQPRSTRCRQCNAASLKEQREAPKPLVERMVFTGLRGPGGELEAMAKAGNPYWRRKWGAKPC